jgi:hypothetical protein
MLKHKVDVVPGKGPTPAAGKWNNTYLKVMIQWFKRDGDNFLLLQFWETQTRVLDETSTYPHEEVEAAVALVASTVATVTSSATLADAAVGHKTVGTTRSYSTAAQDDLKTFFLLILVLQLHHMMLLPIP